MRPAWGAALAVAALTMGGGAFGAAILGEPAPSDHPPIRIGTTLDPRSSSPREDDSARPDEQHSGVVVVTPDPQEFDEAGNPVSTDGDPPTVLSNPSTPGDSGGGSGSGGSGSGGSGSGGSGSGPDDEDDEEDDEEDDNSGHGGGGSDDDSDDDDSGSGHDDDEPDDNDEDEEDDDNSGPGHGSDNELDEDDD